MNNVMVSVDHILSILVAHGLDKFFNELLNTSHSIQIKNIDITNKRNINTYQLINHYFAGKNYWELITSVFYVTQKNRTIFAGDTLKSLYIDLDFYLIIDDLDYQEYIKQKFNSYVPIRVIETYTTPDYKMMPDPPKQDNKRVKVGSGNGYLHDVRFPSRKRGKSTWKRFWKLFPKYDGCYSKKEYYQKESDKLKKM